MENRSKWGGLDLITYSEDYAIKKLNLIKRLIIKYT
jgi:hypothetical protein